MYMCLYMLAGRGEKNISIESLDVFHFFFFSLPFDVVNWKSGSMSDCTWWTRAPWWYLLMRWWELLVHVDRSVIWWPRRRYLSDDIFDIVFHRMIFSSLFSRADCMSKHGGQDLKENVRWRDDRVRQVCFPSDDIPIIVCCPELNLRVYTEDGISTTMFVEKMTEFVRSVTSCWGFTNHNPFLFIIHSSVSSWSCECTWRMEVPKRCLLTRRCFTNYNPFLFIFRSSVSSWLREYTWRTGSQRQCLLKRWQSSAGLSMCQQSPDLSQTIIHFFFIFHSSVSSWSCEYTWKMEVPRQCLLTRRWGWGKSVTCWSRRTIWTRDQIGPSLNRFQNS